MDLGQTAAALTIIAILAGFVTWLVKQNPLSWLQTHWPVSAKEHAEALRSIEELRAEIAALHHVDGILQHRIAAVEEEVTQSQPDLYSRIEDLNKRISDLSELTTAIQVPQAPPFSDNETASGIQRMIEQQQAARNKPLKDPPRF